jgi:hypothetical protein
MARKPSEAALQAAKAKKQKILLLALAPVFLGLMVWQGPKTYNALMGGSPPPPLPVPAPTPVGTGPTSTTPAGELPDSDPQPDLLDGQLLSFSRFSGRDPFVPPSQAGPSDNPSNSQATTIEVNGTAEDLSIGASFPADDPTFRLVSVSATSADIRTGRRRSRSTSARRSSCRPTTAPATPSSSSRWQRPSC